MSAEVKQFPDDSIEKGLKSEAIGLLSSVVIGTASTAPPSA